jgi:parallel beta-helix repeat protein
MRILLRVLVVGLFFFGGGDLFAQGGLTPPGPPAPTMKTLDQIDADIQTAGASAAAAAAGAEKRIPIDATHTPGDASDAFIISQPGSYYFGGNIAISTGVTGILVQASNVTIDLNGFSLTSSTANSGPGIKVLSGNHHITIRHGAISGWTQSGISVLAVSNEISDDLFENLHVSGSGSTGLNAGSSSLVRNCICNSNGNAGIIVGANSLVIDCMANSNFVAGIVLGAHSQASHCVANFNGSSAGIFAQGDGCAVQECTCNANFTGISMSNGSGHTVRGCTAKDNAITGILFGDRCQVIGNTCDGNDTTKAGAASISSSGDSNTISFNHVTNTLSGDGIHTSGASNTIDSNVCANNQGVGIVAAGNGSVNNFIVRNSCTGNTGGNYNIPGPTSKNSFGPVVDMSSGGTIAAGANPWTNWIH